MLLTTSKSIEVVLFVLKEELLIVPMRTANSITVGMSYVSCSALIAMVCRKFVCIHDGLPCVLGNVG